MASGRKSSRRKPSTARRAVVAGKVASRPAQRRPKAWTPAVPLADRYQILSPPYEGGFGRVYKAADIQSPGVHVAVKLPLNPRDPEHVRRFQREIDSLQVIEHPNVMKLIAKYPQHQPPFAVYEYVAGGTLADQIRDKPLALDLGLLVLHQIAGALSAFHARNGFHRDVKPDNIMISAEGAYVLVDCNLANIPGATQQFTTTYAGTQGYRDPWVANLPFDSLGDIWSLGITVAQALTGRSPTDLAPQGELSLNASILGAPHDSKAPALSRLLNAMTRKDRALRPTAIATQQFATALISGGPLPRLPGEKPASPPRATMPVPAVPQDAGAGAFVLVALLIVGVAALLASNGKGPGGGPGAGGAG